MKKKILFILPWLPYPMKSGGHQALFNGIAAIKNDFDIYLTYEANEGEDYRNAEQGFLNNIPQANLLPLINKIKEGKTPLAIRVLAKIKGFISHCLYGYIQRPIIQNDHKLEREWLNNILPKSPEFIEHIYKICSNNQFDIVQVEMPKMISYVLSLPSSVKKVYVHHEIGFVRRNLEIQNNNSVYAEACKKFADYNEVKELNLYDTIITLSLIDADKLKKAGVVVPIRPSFATINTSMDCKIQLSNGKQLSFIGPDNHNPNVVGLTWFLDNCWEKLKNIDNGYNLRIIGKWTENHIKEYMGKYSDISFLGHVPDLDNVIKGTIMIVPITIGSGIRMKILEACSKGVPFVSTTVGAEGLPLESGKHCFITDSSKEFVDDIIKLQNPDIQNKFVINANKMVKENYSIDSLRNNRLAIYNLLWN